MRSFSGAAKGDGRNAVQLNTMSTNGNVRRSESRSPETQAPAPSAADRDLLESVLQWTEATLAADDLPEAADMDALREVARRYRGEPLSPGPVAVELVQAMLRTRFRAHVDWQPVWQNASTLIAETLLEDPGSRRRLEVLWEHLVRDA